MTGIKGKTKVGKVRFEREDCTSQRVELVRTGARFRH